MGRTPSDSLRRLRASILGRPELVGAPLRAALVEAYDSWLADRVSTDIDGVALVAVGSLGRREPSPASDLDLVLLHDAAHDVAELADAIWYPIWDAKVGLDHSVRTPAQTLDVARNDLKALLGLLDLRHLAGDAALSTQLRGQVLHLWRSRALACLDELREVARARWTLAGDAAFLLEPNLKESRGGLRDVRLLHAFALAQLVDLPMSVRAASAELLDVRGELHRVTVRSDDVLRLQELDAVAAALGSAGRDAVLRRVNLAARTVAHELDLAIDRIAANRPSASLRRRLFGTAPARAGLTRDVVAQDGLVVLARDAVPRSDPGLVMRAARAAATHRLPFAAHTLTRLADEAAPLSPPWPDEVRADFVALLGTGSAAVPVLEALDFTGLLGALIPEWDRVRSLAQHNPVHRYTVDRHLLESAAHAAGLTRSVARPDLLLVGALLHDIGKGYPGDHAVVGADVARTIAARMGFLEGDADTISALARHHLLLPDTATRRDLDDPRTIALVTDAVGEDTELLALLHALSIADGAATGPSAWSDWKANLIAELVRRSKAVLHGHDLPRLPPLDAERRELADTGEFAVRVRDRTVLVAASDGVGVLYRTVGVLALHLLDIRQASVRTSRGMAVNSFVVEPRFGRMPDEAVLRVELARALAGELPLAERLRAKERAYAEPDRTKPPTVAWFDAAATDATVLEIRTEDSIGLLTRICAVLEHAQLDIRTAQTESLGRSVVGSFYLTDRRGARVAPSVRKDVELALRRT